MQDGMLENAVFHAPDQVSEPICGLFLALCVQQIVHVCREARNERKPEVEAVVSDVVVCGDVIEVLGCGYLACRLGPDVQKALFGILLHHADEAVYLARYTG